MTASRNRPSLGLALAVAILALPIGVGSAPAAEQPSAQDIIEALKAPRMTRGLTTSPAVAARAAEDSKFVDTLRNRTTRSLTTDEREKIASIADSKPKIDLEINFEFNSATIAAKALPQVTALGEALTSPDLKGRTFIVAGHTDAKGSETYNQGLSERRADAVNRVSDLKGLGSPASPCRSAFDQWTQQRSHQTLGGRDRVCTDAGWWRTSSGTSESCPGQSFAFYSLLRAQPRVIGRTHCRNTFLRGIVRRIGGSLHQIPEKWHQARTYAIRALKAAHKTGKLETEALAFSEFAERCPASFWDVQI